MVSLTDNTAQSSAAATLTHLVGDLSRFIIYTWVHRWPNKADGSWVLSL